MKKTLNLLDLMNGKAEKKYQSDLSKAHFSKIANKRRGKYKPTHSNG
jgi:hypothetical protein